MTEVEVKRVEGSTFLARGSSNHWVVVDARPENHGREGGARPIELLLMALGGAALGREILLGYSYAERIGGDHIGSGGARR